MSTPSWPPVIRAGRMPAWVRVRDLVLTLAAWALLLYWVGGALMLAWDWLSYPIDELGAAPRWKPILSRVAPYLAISVLLVAWLVFWAVRRHATLVRQQWVPQPGPLSVESHAARYGLVEADVVALRAGRTTTVRFDKGRPTGVTEDAA